MEETTEQRLERRRREREEQKKKFEEDLAREEAELAAAREKRKQERERKRQEEAEADRQAKEQDEQRRSTRGRVSASTSHSDSISTLASSKSHDDGLSKAAAAAEPVVAKPVVSEAPVPPAEPAPQPPQTTTTEHTVDASSRSAAAAAELQAATERRKKLEEDLRLEEEDRERRKQERLRKREQRQQSVAGAPSNEEVLQSVSHQRSAAEEEAAREEERIRTDRDKRRVEKEAQEAADAARAQEEAEAQAAKARLRRQQEEEAVAAQEKARRAEQERQEAERERAAREAAAAAEAAAKAQREREAAEDSRRREEEQRRADEAKRRAAEQAEEEAARRRKEEDETNQRRERERVEAEARAAAEADAAAAAERAAAEVRQRRERERAERAEAEARAQAEADARARAEAEAHEHAEAEARRAREQAEAAKAQEAAAAKAREEEAAAAKAREEEAKAQAEKAAAKAREEEKAAAKAREEEKAAAKAREEEAKAQAEKAAAKAREDEAAAKASKPAEDKPMDREERRRQREAAERQEEEERKRAIQLEDERLAQEREQRKRDREERLKRIDQEAASATSSTRTARSAEPVAAAKPAEVKPAEVKPVETKPTVPAVAISTAPAVEPSSDDASSPTGDLPLTPTSDAPKLIHLTASRIKATKRHSGTGNVIRSLGKMEGVDIVEKLKETFDEPKQEPKTAPKPAGLSALLGSGNSKAAALAAQSAAAAAAAEEEAERAAKEKRSGFKPPVGAAMMGGMAGQAAAALAAKKARPVSMFPVVNVPKEDPQEAKERMKALADKKKPSIATPGVKVDKPMFQLKGKKRTFVMQVPNKASSLNHGDVFIRDTGEAVFVWNGTAAPQVKRAKGLEVAHRIKDKDYTGRIDVIVIDGMEDSKNSIKFWRGLGSRDDVKSAEEGGDDVEFEKDMDSKFKLYEVSKSEEPSVVVENSRGMLKEVLKNSKVLVLDAWSEIYVWVGRNSDPDDKPVAEKFAKKISEEGMRPLHTTVSVEESLSERTIFREKFVDWKEADASLAVKQQGNIQAQDKKFRVYDRGSDARKVEKIDVEKMIFPEELAREADLFDLKHNGKGTVIKFWYCQEKEKHELPHSELGFFYSAESYVFLFEFAQKNREGPGERNVFVMYFWLGKDCRISEKGTSALLAIELDKQYGAPQVRVAQGREPADFTAIFKNKMITRSGSKRDYDHKAQALFQVRGLRNNAVKAEQVALTSASLNSADAFIAVSSSMVYVWYGLGAFDYQEDAALAAAELLSKGRPVEEVTEKKEPAEFWSILGGQRPYCTSEEICKTKRGESEYYGTRLYRMHFAGARGNPTAEEVEHFGQKDLEPETVYIADTFFELFVWVGRTATKSVKDVRLAVETGLDYVAYAEEYLGRLSKQSAWLIHEGYEPTTFRGLFMGWEEWDSEREELERPLKLMDFKPISLTDALNNYLNAKHTVAALRAPELPFGVDAATLEEYIQDDEFSKHFGVSKTDYLALPKWKQTESKRKSGLF